MTSKDQDLSTVARRVRGAASRLLSLSTLGLLLAAAPADAGVVRAADLKEDLSGSNWAVAGFNTKLPLPGPVVSVVSTDGVNYSHVQPGGLTFGVWAKSRCSANSLDSKVEVRIGNHDTTLVEGWGGSLFSGLIDGQKVSVPTPYQAPAMAHPPVAACNHRAAELEAAGTPRWQVLQGGFVIEVAGAYPARLKVTCGKVIKDTQEVNRLLRGWIHCKPSPLAKAPPRRTDPPRPPPPPTLPPQAATDFKQAFFVTEASIRLPQSNKTAPCPTELLVQASITANGPGQVKFRFLHNNAPGPVTTARFARAGTEKVETKLTVGQSGQGGLTGGGSGGGGGIGGLAQQPGHPDQIQGNVRLEMVDTPGVKLSDPAHYTVTCKATQAAGGIATAQPAPPSAVGIQQPTEGKRYCAGPVPVQVAAPAFQQPVPVALQWQSLQAGCGNPASDACWQERTAQVLPTAASMPAATAVPREKFPQLGPWRLRARLGQGSWTPWRRFELGPTGGCR